MLGVRVTRATCGYVRARNDLNQINYIEYIGNDGVYSAGLGFEIHSSNQWKKYVGICVHVIVLTKCNT